MVTPLAAKSRRLAPYCRRHHRDPPCLYCTYEEDMKEQKERSDRLWKRLKIVGLLALAVMLLLLYCT
jgi:hypothetical protein